MAKTFFVKDAAGKDRQVVVYGNDFSVKALLDAARKQNCSVTRGCNFVINEANQNVFEDSPAPTNCSLPRKRHQF